MFIYLFVYLKIYLLSCKVCGLQHVGFATDKFRLKWNNYKENNSKAKKKEEHILL